MFVDKALGYCAYNGLFYKFRIVNRARWDLFLLLHWYNEVIRKPSSASLL